MNVADGYYVYERLLLGAVRENVLQLPSNHPNVYNHETHHKEIRKVDADKYCW